MASCLPSTVSGISPYCCLKKSSVHFLRAAQCSIPSVMMTGFEWQDILADIALLSDVRPTMPVDLIDKLRSANFCHDCPQSFGSP